MSYTPADVDLVETAWLDATACGHDMRLDYPEACSRCAARAVLSALAAAGRLLPADAEVETLWAWDCGENKVGPHLHHGEERWARTVASRTWPTGRLMRKWHAEGPWEPA